MHPDIVTKAMHRRLTASGLDVNHNKSKKSNSNYLYVREHPEAEDSLSVRISDHQNPAFNPMRVSDAWDKAEVTDHEVRTDKNHDWRGTTNKILAHFKKSPIITLSDKMLKKKQENREKDRERERNKKETENSIRNSELNVKYLKRGEIINKHVSQDLHGEKRKRAIRKLRLKGILDNL